MDKLLPIGSVVTLKKVLECEFMIIGYLQEFHGRIYDYLSVLYPNGMLGEDSCFVFCSEEVGEILYKGYCDEEGTAITEMVPKLAGVMSGMMEQHEKK